MKAWDADVTMTALKVKAREAKESGDERLAGFTNGCLMIMQGLPTLNVSDGIECRRCFFYDGAQKRCSHRNGLSGRVLPGYYCSYGSYHYEPCEDEDNDDFSDFDEVGQEDENDG